MIKLKSESPSKTLKSSQEKGKTNQAQIIDLVKIREQQERINQKKDEKTKELVEQIQSGDYMIHVYIEMTKCLNIPQNERQEVIALVQIPQLNVKQFSLSKKDVAQSSELTWNDHVFIETKGVSQIKLQDARIEVEIQQKSGQKLFNNSIGACEFSLESVYQSNDHTLLHQWAALTESSSQNQGEITGYLKVSIQVTGNKDQIVPIKEEKDVLTQRDYNVMISSTVQLKYIQLTFRLFSAQGLSDMMQGSFLNRNTIDAFVKFELAGKLITSKIVTQTKDKKIEWNQEFVISVQIPPILDQFYIQVWDKNDGDDNDFILGTIPMKISKLIQMQDNFSLHWHNIYGAPVHNKRKETSEMNLNPALASKWKGKVLMQVDSVITTKPVSVVKDISLQDQTTEFKELFFQSTKTTTFEICIDIALGMCLPTAKQYSVRVQLAEFFFQTAPAKNRMDQAKGGFNLWAERIDKQVNLSCKEVEEIGWLFIYLIEDDQPICYKKLKTSLFTKEFPEWRFDQLAVDPSIDKVENKNKAGIIQFRAFIRKQQKDTKPIRDCIGPDFSKTGARATPYNIRAYIYQCKDLPAGDEDGLSDPFIQIWDKNKTVERTKTVKDTLNPIIHEVRDFNFEVYLDEAQKQSLQSAELEKANQFKKYQKLLKYASPVVLDIFDEDSHVVGAKTKDFLCRSVIFLRNASCRFIDKNSGKILYESSGRQEQLKDGVQGTLTSSGNKGSAPLTDKQLTANIGRNLSVSFSENANTFREQNKFSPPQPTWHPCYFQPDSPESGKILISFDISDHDHVFIPSLDKLRLRDYIKMNYLTINILTLGLRNLQSVGILPVKKATITFDFESLSSLQTKDSIQVKNFTTVPGPTGPNPTINSILKNTLYLPIQRDICPILTCKVKDNIFAGWSQPAIGNFSIDIAEILSRKNKEYQAFLYSLEQLLQNVQSFKSNVFPPSYHPGDNNNSLNNLENQKFLIHKKKSGDENILGLNNSGLIDKRLELLIQSERLIDKNQILKQYVDCEEQQEEEIQENQSLLQLLPKFKEEDYTEHELGLLKNYDNKLLQKLCENHNRVQLAKETLLIQEQINNDKNDHLQEIAKNMEDLLQEKIHEQQNQQSLAQSAARAQAEDQFKKKFPDKTDCIVIFPEYTMDERLGCQIEYKIPPKELFLPIGHNFTPESKTKHYRKYYDEALENIKEIIAFKPFEIWKLKKENKRPKKGFLSFFTRTSSQVALDNNQKYMGLFKGLVNVYVEEERKNQEEKKNNLINQIIETINGISLDKQFPDNLSIKQLEKTQSRREFNERLVNIGLNHLNVMDKILRGDRESFVQKQLLTKQRQLIELYIIDGFNLASRDLIGKSDPYLYITLGDQKFNDSKNYINDEDNPDFYKHFKFISFFPGCSLLIVQIKDFDDIFGDDIIGSTEIDLEDRFYSYQWQSFVEKPIETRKIYHKAYGDPQGTIRFWVEINPEFNLNPDDRTIDWDITPSPEEEFEIRICVWDAKDVKMMDIEGTSDVYITATMNDLSQETETHYRCTTGNANFNYRLNIPFINKRKGNDKRLVIKCFDKDLITRDELIGERLIDLTDPIQDCLSCKRQVSVNKKLYEDYLCKLENWSELDLKFYDNFSFYVDLYGIHDGIRIKGGSVRLQIDVIPKEDALKSPAGKGRNEPNQNPFLPPPEGRFQLSLDPRKMFVQLIGPQLIEKIQKAFAMAVCIAICIYITPNIVANVVGALITKVLFG